MKRKRRVTLSSPSTETQERELTGAVKNDLASTR
jgi:hypothetical protein